MLPGDEAGIGAGVEVGELDGSGVIVASGVAVGGIVLPSLREQIMLE